MVNFDNILFSILTVFQCTTLEGWTAIMYNYQDSYEKYQTTIFFVNLVLMCALLFMNIIVAILFDNYENGDDDEEKAEIAELREKASKIGIIHLWFPKFDFCSFKMTLCNNYTLLTCSNRDTSKYMRYHHNARYSMR